MHDMLINGLTVFGIARLERIDNKKPMDDYEAGEQNGRRMELDDVMSNFVGADHWQLAKERYHAERSTKGDVQPGD